MQSDRGISLLHSFFIAEVDEHLLIETPKIKKGKKKNKTSEHETNITQWKITKWILSETGDFSYLHLW